MTVTRNVTREDVLLKTRLFTEGVRYEFRGESLWDPIPEGQTPEVPIVMLDGCDLSCRTRPNQRSRIDVIIDGNDVTISEMGQVLVTGKLEPRASWRDAPLPSGGIVDDAFRGGAFWSDIPISNRCYACDFGGACRFCGAGVHYARGGPLMEFDELVASAERHIEATSVAIQNGWSGMILFVGGALPPDKRGSWTSDLFEAMMERFRHYLDDATIAANHFHSYVYPPDDLGEMHKWKSFGINRVLYDCQVMDPAYFRAICPGRGDQKRWFEAQEAAVEIFGVGNCTGNIVAGLEPMAGMLEGIEERVSKGVHVTPSIFEPMKDTPLEGMQPATAEWYMEAWEKTAEIYQRHGYGPRLAYGLTGQPD